MNCDALIVGINRYDRLHPLRLPAADAEAIARLLGEQGDFRITRLPERIAPDRTGVAIDPDARVCEAALERAIVQLFRPAGDQHPDTALLFVAGHGLQYNPGLPVSSLAASDTDPEARRLGLSLKWLGELLQASPVRNQIVWLDTCHSGGLLDFRQADPGRGTRCLIAASRNFEAAFETIDGRHGVLTGALLQGLDPAHQPDGRVTNLTLAADINRLLAGENQHPLCANSGEAISLTRRAVELAISASPTGRCPYKGLRFFDRDGEDPADFFGRRALTDQLIDRLRQASFLAILGVSGSGKSSVVRAGLLHALTLGERIGGSHAWRQVIMVPGSNPLASLHAALIRQQTDVDEALAADLLATGTAQALADIVCELTNKPLPGGGVGVGGGHRANSSSQTPATPSSTNRLILLIDQFEEVFTNAGDAARQSFLACLLGALDLAADRLTLIITLRADFYAKCAEQDYCGLARRIQDHQVIVQPMSTAELREAIVAPARRVGLTVDDDLVVQLVEEVHDAPGNLPLLQDTLTELWQQVRDRGGAAGRLTLADYRIQEGLAGTLRRRADLIYQQSLDAEEQAAAQWVLIQLTRLGEGTEDTRRRLPQYELVNARFGAGLIARTVAKLASPTARLLVTSSLLPRGGEADSQIATCEVAHEALIREWPLLRQWLDENREFQTWLRRIQIDARDWGGPRAHRDRELLPVGTRLAVALEYRASHSGLLDALTEAYIDAAVEQQEQKRAAEQERQERERRAEAARLEEQRLAEQQRRDEQVRAREERQRTRLFWTRLTAALIGVGLVISLVLGYLVSVARDQARAAEQASKDELFESRLTHAALLAGKEDYAAASRVLGQSVDLDPFIRAGRRSARNLLAGFVNLYRGEADLVYRGPGAALMALVLSPDGRWLVASGERGTLVAFDTTGAEPIRPLVSHAPAAGSVGAVTAVCFSPDGGRLYSAGEDGRIVVWSTPDWFAQEVWPATEGVQSMALSPDGRVLASAGQGVGISLRSTASGALLDTLVGASSSVSMGTNLKWFPDGRQLVSGGLNGKVSIWDTLTRKERPLAGEHGGAVSSVAVRADGLLVASGGEDRMLIIAEAATGRTIGFFKAQDSDVPGLAFDGSGQYLFSAGKDQSVKAWDTRTGTTLRVYQGHEAGASSIVLRDQTLYTASDDGTIRRWQLGLVNQWVWDLKDAVPMAAAVDPDGGLVLVGLEDGSIRTYALPGAGSGSTAARIPGIRGGSSGWGVVDSGPDTLRKSSTMALLLDAMIPGKSAVAQDLRLSIRPVRPAPGRPARPHRPERLERREQPAWPFGSLAPMGPKFDYNLSRLQGQDRPRWAVIPGPSPVCDKIGSARGNRFSGFALSPDGQTLATASDEGEVQLWGIVPDSCDWESRTLHTPDQGSPGAMRALAFSPDGHWLASAGDGGQVGIYDVASRDGDLYRVDEPGKFASVQIDTSGTRVITANRDARTVQPWRLADQRLAKGQTLAEFADKPLGITLNPDGNQIAAVGRGSNVTLIDLDVADRPAHKRRLFGHQNTVYRAIYTPDGGLLATVSADMTVRLWDLKTDAALFTLHLPAEDLDPGPLWDFDFRCTRDQQTCWIAVPLTMGRLALYRLPYAYPPASIAGSLASTAGAAN